MMNRMRVRRPGRPFLRRQNRLPTRGSNVHAKHLHLLAPAAPTQPRFHSAARTTQLRSYPPLPPAPQAPHPAQTQIVLPTPAPPVIPPPPYYQTDMNQPNKLTVFDDTRHGGQTFQQPNPLPVYNDVQILQSLQMMHGEYETWEKNTRHGGSKSQKDLEELLVFLSEIDNEQRG